MLIKGQCCCPYAHMPSDDFFLNRGAAYLVCVYGGRAAYVIHVCGRAAYIMCVCMVGVHCSNALLDPRLSLHAHAALPILSCRPRDARVRSGGSFVQPSDREDSEADTDDGTGAAAPLLPSVRDIEEGEA